MGSIAADARGRTRSSSRRAARPSGSSGRVHRHRCCSRREPDAVGPRGERGACFPLRDPRRGDRRAATGPRSRPFDREERRAGDSARRLRGQGVENARPARRGDRCARTERARLSDQLITAEQEERRRLALFLHDGPVQSLAGIGLMLDAAIALDRRQPARRGHGACSRRARPPPGHDPLAARSLVQHRAGRPARPGVRAGRQRRSPTRSGSRTRSSSTSTSSAAEELAEKAQVGLYQIIREAVNQAIRRGPPTRISIRVEQPGRRDRDEIARRRRRRAPAARASRRSRSARGRSTDASTVEAGANGGTAVRVTLPRYVAARRRHPMTKIAAANERERLPRSSSRSRPATSFASATAILPASVTRSRRTGRGCDVTKVAPSPASRATGAAARTSSRSVSDVLGGGKAEDERRRQAARVTAGRRRRPRRRRPRRGRRSERPSSSSTRARSSTAQAADRVRDRGRDVNGDNAPSARVSTVAAGRASALGRGRRSISRTGVSRTRSSSAASSSSTRPARPAGGDRLDEVGLRPRGLVGSTNSSPRSSRTRAKRPYSCAWPTRTRPRRQSASAACAAVELVHAAVSAAPRGEAERAGRRRRSRGWLAGRRPRAGATYRSTSSRSP